MKPLGFISESIESYYDTKRGTMAASEVNVREGAENGPDRRTVAGDHRGPAPEARPGTRPGTRAKAEGARRARRAVGARAEAAAQAREGARVMADVFPTDSGLQCY